MTGRFISLVDRKTHDGDVSEDKGTQTLFQGVFVGGIEEEPILLQKIYEEEIHLEKL